MSSLSWLVSSASLLQRGHQDAWLLEGIAFQMLLTVAFFVLFVVRETNLQRVALATAAITFALSAAPVLKYTFTYSSTVDNATHLATIHTIATTGFVDTAPRTYAFTPGFHALAAVMAQLSSTDALLWSRLTAGMLQATFPIGIYYLCARTAAPVGVAKATIVLSSLSVPATYYLLEGTSFTMVLSLGLVITYINKEIYRGRDLVFSDGIVSILLLVAVILWHPSSSLVVSGLFVLTGVFALLDHKGLFFSGQAGYALRLGLTLIVFAIAYWMYSADFVWSRFVLNINAAIYPLIASGVGDVGAKPLIPKRFFEISLTEKFVIAMLYHARDVVMLGTASLGFMFVIAQSRHRATSQYVSMIRGATTLWLASILVLILVFVAGFGVQGYRRFLAYVLLISPLLSGYACWQIFVIVRRIRIGVFLKTVVLLVSLSAIFALSLIQLYPYQPAVPKFDAVIGREGSRIISDYIWHLPHEKERGTNDSPVLWFHQVNTQYQYNMLEFALTRLSPDEQLTVDVVGYHQAYLFFGFETRNRLRRPYNSNRESGYFLLHWPGYAGAYGERVEYRSTEAIAEWRAKEFVNTVYDNGGSFIIYLHKDSGYFTELRNWR